MKIIVEGVDRLGKNLLIDNIIDNYGFHFVIHYSKPKKMAVYDFSLYNYQHHSFLSGFDLLFAPDVPVIYNRFHLGEFVYSPMYRDYSGDYVFDMEKSYRVNENNDVRLILLTTSNFEFIQDDGDSFDFDKKETEQKRFVEAYFKSIIEDKRIVDVHNGRGGFRDAEDIYREAMQ